MSLVLRCQGLDGVWLAYYKTGMRIIGVDPGSKGAFAVIENMSLVLVEDMPTVTVKRGTGKTAKNRTEVNVYDVDQIVRRLGEAAVCVFEHVSSKNTDAAAAAFTFGRNVMASEYPLRLAYRVELVVPTVWQREFKLLGKDKSESRAAAQRLWPSQAHLFARVKDDGRAEAALIAEWGRRKFCGGVSDVFD